MAKVITLKRLNYYKTLAILRSKRKTKTKSTVAKPKKTRKKTIRDRMQQASLALFTRKDKAGNKLCRNVFCPNYAKDGYYCSATCRKKFLKYYEENYIWQNVRYKIFKRDNFTCQICKKRSFIADLECDHIRPVSLMKEYGYKTLNLKAFDEYIYNEKNLRTLCKECHKGVTNTYMRNKDQIRRELNK